MRTGAVVETLMCMGRYIDTAALVDDDSDDDDDADDVDV